jgi:hypothetical protein
MLEPDRSMLYNTLMAKLIPVTVIECFEPKFNPLKGFDEDARKSLDKCVEKFKADEVQYKAWVEFMKMLTVIEEEEKVNPT